LTGTDGGDGGFDDRVRRVCIANTLREVDAVHGIAGYSHGANFGLYGVRREIAEAEIGGGIES